MTPKMVHAILGYILVTLLQRWFGEPSATRILLQRVSGLERDSAFLKSRVFTFCPFWFPLILGMVHPILGHVLVTLTFGPTHRSLFESRGREGEGGSWIAQRTSRTHQNVAKMGSGIDRKSMTNPRYVANAFLDAPAASKNPGCWERVRFWMPFG